MPLLVYSEGVAEVDGMGEISPQTGVVSAAVRGGVVEVEVVGEGAAQGKFLLLFSFTFYHIERKCHSEHNGYYLFDFWLKVPSE